MAFPEYKIEVTIHKFLFFKWQTEEELPHEWHDLGEVESTQRSDGSWGTITEWQAHALCMTRLQIGKENKEVFQYCPRCYVKVK